MVNLNLANFNTSKAKENKSDKFDSLFDENSQVEDKHDDLPF